MNNEKKTGFRPLRPSFLAFLLVSFGLACAKATGIGEAEAWSWWVAAAPILFWVAMNALVFAVMTAVYGWSVTSAALVKMYDERL